MGILYNQAQFLIWAKHKYSIKFGHMLTLGHQTLYVAQKRIDRLGKKYSIDSGGANLKGNHFADDFFKCFLGAEKIDSLDFSEHEGCTILHDMNTAIRTSLHNSFDVIIDGGALEHIFNFPTAIENCMNMIKPGGSMFIFSPANNCLGHGFYQFSPELFYRIFQPENGFEIRDVILIATAKPVTQMTSKFEQYSVIDPAQIKDRVGLITNKQVGMMVHAVKTHKILNLSLKPIQSDYVELAGRLKNTITPDNKKSDEISLKGILKKFLRKMPMAFRCYIYEKKQMKKYSLANKTFFIPWDAN